MNKEKSMALAINKEELNYINLHWNRWSFIIEIIKKIPECHRILDIGCAGGVLDILLKKAGYTLHCIDIQRKESFEWIKRFNKYGIIFQNCDITEQKLPFNNNYFDLVIFSEVLEHLITSHPPYFIFNEIRRVMKPDSYLILSTPNVVALHKRILITLGKNPTSHGFKDKLSYQKHFREYSREEVEYALNEVGFNIEQIFLKNFLFKLPYSILAHYKNFRDTIIVICKK